MSSQSFPTAIQPLKSVIAQRPIGAEVLALFRSVHLAIVLLLLMAIGTIIGVVMPQEGMVELADIQEKYGSSFEFYRNLGFFNVFSSFWFLTLQILFFFNLLIGSFKWLKPATLAAVQKTFLTPDLIVHKPEAHSLSQLSSLDKSGLEKTIRAVLKRFHYKVHHDGQGNLYACKGNITRLGPCIAHVGILICLIAGVYSAFTGFKAIRMATPGQTFSIFEADTFKTNMSQDLWLGEIPDWKIRVKDFQIEFYEDHPETAKQYYSRLQVVSPDGKQVLKEETISVNHPLLYDNLSIYQASYAPTGRFLVQYNDMPLALGINNQFNQRPISITPLPDKNVLIMFPFFAGQDPGVTKNYGVFFLRKAGEPMTTGRMPENLRLQEGQTGHLKGADITYLRPEMSTGLQIKRAPEVPMMYLSYGIIALGTLLCFFSQRQIWISLKALESGKIQLLLHPKTNKARLSFRKEIVMLEAALCQVVAPRKIRQNS